MTFLSFFTLKKGGKGQAKKEIRKILT